MFPRRNKLATCLQKLLIWSLAFTPAFIIQACRAPEEKSRTKNSVIIHLICALVVSLTAKFGNSVLEAWLFVIYNSSSSFKYLHFQACKEDRLPNQGCSPQPMTSRRTQKRLWRQRLQIRTSMDDKRTSALAEPLQLRKLRLIPPSQVSWLGEQVPMTTSANVNQERWDIRLRNGKLIVRTKWRAKASRLIRWLQQCRGIQILGNGINAQWEEEHDSDAGVVSDVLRGEYGSEASRWLLNHIWRGNILVSSKSPTSCYCPTNNDNEGYNVCALIPFEVINNTRFYYDREYGTLYWMPREGDKLREVYVSSGGSIRFSECDFESENLIKCSIDGDEHQRVG